ncbi:hypothetical protein THASP1DRAFT_30374 [Thamnocephalis sphaerospora]|uniref:F-box domain-containing protein n=1 Tax=Thamnocephalis sphaerospora TaxID=78915 RepID=A0A4P9XP90_9FUNG|nr:hypothetical protein THASP1DRAFT_30374 [Thamnocephalis sphaerospora]|eukprot:RKP07813.1 hypothetical protein THASP1DRAFT_30374 [Thamnocephalis sphaerospora]
MCEPQMPIVPPEVVERIATQLDWRSALCLGVTCRRHWQLIPQHQLLWRQYYLQTFPTYGEERELDAFLRARLVSERARASKDTDTRNDQSQQDGQSQQMPERTPHAEPDWAALFRRRMQLQGHWARGCYAVRRIQLPLTLDRNAAARPFAVASCASYTLVFQPPRPSINADGHLFIVPNEATGEDENASTPRALELPRSIRLLGSWSVLVGSQYAVVDADLVLLVVSTSAPSQTHLCIWDAATGRLRTHFGIPSVDSAWIVERRGRWVLLGLGGDRWWVYDIYTTTVGQPVWASNHSGGKGFRFGHSRSADESVDSDDGQDWIDVLCVTTVPNHSATLQWRSHRCWSTGAQSMRTEALISLWPHIQTVRHFSWMTLPKNRLLFSITGDHREQLLVMASCAQMSILWTYPQRDAPTLPLYLPCDDLLVVSGWVEDLDHDDSGRITSRRRIAGQLFLDAKTGTLRRSLKELDGRASSMELAPLLLVRPALPAPHAHCSLVNADTGMVVRHLSAAECPNPVKQVVGATHCIVLDTANNCLVLHDYAIA